MDRYLTLTTLIFGFHLSSCSQFPLRQYHYVDLKLSWADAQQYCREKYSDLATFESVDDIKRLTENPYSSRAWIGLSDDPKSWKTSMGSDPNSWRWSATGETSRTGYQSWGSGYPNFYGGRETCVLTSQGEWQDKNCDLRHTFLCYDVLEENKKDYVHIQIEKTWDSAREYCRRHYETVVSSCKSLLKCVAVSETNQKNYLYIPIEMTWDSAREYCREHYEDLATIENEEENSEVNNVAPAEASAWIGLYRVPWSWSDKSPSSFKWHTVDFDNGGGDQHCAWEDENHTWGDRKCDSQINFICQQVVNMSTTVRITMATDADLTDPAVNTPVLQQLHGLLTSRGFTGVKLRWKIQPKKEKRERGIH